MKFRVWDKQRKVFLHESQNARDAHNLYIDLQGNLTSVNYPNAEILAGNFVLQRFTELYDMHGKPIYEGDVVETYLCFDRIYRIQPKEKIYIAAKCFQDSNLVPLSSGGPDGCEVFEDMKIIGHIYDEKNYELHHR
jgi:hypothetical protein